MPRKVLIVEDDRDCREILALQLRRMGYEVAEASDAELGLRKALGEGPDLIIMDLALPGMNGIDAMAKLKQDPKVAGIPVIAYTVWDEPSIRQRAMDAGIAVCLSKPTLPEVFKEVIERLLP